MPFFPNPIFHPELVVRASLPNPVRSLSLRPSDAPPPYPPPFVDMPLGVRSGLAADALRPRRLLLLTEGGEGERPDDVAPPLVADSDDMTDELRSAAPWCAWCSAGSWCVLPVLSVPTVPRVVAVPWRWSGERASSFRLRMDQRADLSPDDERCVVDGSRRIVEASRRGWLSMNAEERSVDAVVESFRILPFGVPDDEGREGVDGFEGFDAAGSEEAAAAGETGAAGIGAEGIGTGDFFGELTGGVTATGTAAAAGTMGAAAMAGESAGVD